MTSGQGTGSESGQPPQGQPPQAPPPYGGAPQAPPYGGAPQAPPYGQAPPSGYPPSGQPPYGYLPAPSAPSGWGQEAPKAVERPVTVRAGLGAFLGSIVLSVVGSIVTVLNWNEFVSFALAQAEAPGQLDTSDTPIDAADFAEVILRITIVFSIVFLALYLLFIWFAWKGYNWARIVLWVLGGLGVVFGLYGLAAGSTGGPFPFLTAISWFQWLFIVAGIVLLALKPSHEWYRYRKWLRATGQPG